jgi:hypothetical protein
MILFENLYSVDKVRFAILYMFVQIDAAIHHLLNKCDYLMVLIINESL